MFLALLFSALLQVACALSIKQSSHDHILARGAPMHKRALDTGSKVAIGICIPFAAFTVGLGLFVCITYPAQLRKLRKENPGAEVGLNELMTGNINRKPAQPQPQPPPPQYEANPDHDPADATKPPNYTAQPKADAHAVPPTASETRYAALMS